MGLSVDHSLHRVRMEVRAMVKLKSHTLAETVGLSVDHSLHRARVKNRTLAEKVDLSVDHSLHNIVQWNFKTTLKVKSG